MCKEYNSGEVEDVVHWQVRCPVWRRLQETVRSHRTVRPWQNEEAEVYPTFIVKLLVIKTSPWGFEPCGKHDLDLCETICPCLCTIPHALMPVNMYCYTMF